ncbi:MAG: hypothetical protein ACK55Z_02005, partial [bacterium]
MERLPRGIGHHPATAPIHAVLRQHIAGHVVAGGVSGLRTRRADVLHHPVAAGIFNPERFALRIELAVGDGLLLQHLPIALPAVVADRHHLPPQTVQVRHRRRVGVHGCLAGRLAVLRGVKAGKFRMGWIGAAAIPAVARLQHRVAAIPALLPPGGERHPLHRAIGQLRAHLPARRVVIKNRGDTHLHGLLKAVAAGAEVGLVLQHRLA